MRTGAGYERDDPVVKSFRILCLGDRDRFPFICRHVLQYTALATTPNTRLVYIGISVHILP
ncbi:hypothetical protein ES702_07141 [subsurface metagenome]